MIALAKPKYFVPVHGEYRHLMAHIETAKQLGYTSQNTFIMQNGKVLELNQDEARFTGNVQVGKIMVDGLGVGDVGNIVLRDRQHLYSDGLIIIVLTMDSGSGEVIAGPDVISRGFVYVRESENLMEEVKQMLTDLVADCTRGEIRDWASIKNIIKENLREFIYQKTKSANPLNSCAINLS